MPQANQEGGSGRRRLAASAARPLHELLLALVAGQLAAASNAARASS